MKTWPTLAHTALSILIFSNVLANDVSSATYGEVDYLLWSCSQDDFNTPTAANGKFPNLNSSWNSGFRIGIGKEISCWNGEFFYTYYSNDSHAKVNSSIQTILNSTPSTAGIFEVGEKWKLNFNRVDLQLGRKIFFCDCFTFEPFFGVAALDVTQNFDLKVKTVFLDLMTDLPAKNISKSNNKNRLLGIGPRAGFKVNYDIKSGFGIYGNLGANLFWCRFKLKQNYNEIDYLSSSNVVLADKDKHLSQDGAVFNADLEIGLNWRYACPQSNFEFLVKLGWEQHYYLDIVRFRNFYLQQASFGTADYSTQGNLSLSGITLGAMIKY